jgi:hypothetical protein
VVFASAAALTLGRYTVPVYEIYKVGAEPEWVPGLDLLEPYLGPDVAIIPHYDNAEGGTHDTRFCYLGERRLQVMEEQMPEGAWVLGIDEHTACVFDLDAGSVTVEGNGVVTVRRRGRSSILPAGETLPITALLDMAAGKGATVLAAHAAGDPRTTSPPGDRARMHEPTPLHADIRRLSAEFESAVDKRDADAAVRAALDLDQTLAGWAGDTTQSDANDKGRAALRRMLASLGELARAGTRDPREVVGGYVDALLEERAKARESRRYEDADRIRDRLIALGIEVRDTPAGTEWGFR